MTTTIENLIGKKLKSVQLIGRNEMIKFNCADGTVYEMYHDQDCCEHVVIEDITEDWKDILNDSTVMQAYESTNRNDPPQYCESHTWTFYRIITDKGTVVIRWLGTSNGYYSEGVSIYERTP